jgi:hypothetical protein
MFRITVDTAAAEEGSQSLETEWSMAAGDAGL